MKRIRLSLAVIIALPVLLLAVWLTFLQHQPFSRPDAVSMQRITSAGSVEQPDPGATAAALAATPSTREAPTAPQAPPLPTNTVHPLPTLPVLEETADPVYGAVLLSAPPGVSAPAQLARIGAEGEVYLGDALVFRAPAETDCWGVDQISYSPTFEHFLVILGCFEGDNEAFLFRADGSQKQRVTQAGDLFNYHTHIWWPDGRSFVYKQISGCYASECPAPADVPQAMFIRHHVLTGDKTVPVHGDSLRISGLPAGQELVVRTGPGEEYSVRFRLPGDQPAGAISFLLMAEVVPAGGTSWAPVFVWSESAPFRAGWVDRAYLVEEER